MARASAPAARRAERRLAHRHGRGIRSLAAIPRARRRAWPVVCVFEDLHWADDAMLDFVDSLVERKRGRAAARPRDRATGAAATAAGVGRRQAECPCDLADVAFRRGRIRARRKPRRAVARRRPAGRADRARGRQPAVRGAVRAARSRSAVTSTGSPSPYRGSSPRASTRCPSRRSGCSRTRRWSGRSSGSAQSRRSTGHALAGRGAPPRARAKGVRAAWRALVGRKRDRVRVPSRPDPRRRVRPDSACRACREARASRGVDRLARAIATIRLSSSRTTTCRRSSSRRRPAGARSRWPTPRGSRFATPVSGRRRSRSRTARAGSSMRHSGCGRTDDPRTPVSPDSACGAARQHRGHGRHGLLEEAVADLTLQATTSGLHRRSGCSPGATGSRGSPNRRPSTVGRSEELIRDAHAERGDGGSPLQRCVARDVVWLEP